jgi:poly-gamma-glutamate synthesis protein (capsule biosynthesis protein)
LVSIASTFRPTTDALPPEGASPGRPGLSALHVTRTIVVPDAAMQALAKIDCLLHAHHCNETPATLDLFDMKYRRGSSFFYDYEMDSEDLAEILKNIRSARENADFVIVSIHAHECTNGCDDVNQPRGEGNFLKRLAHEAIDSGADLFVTTGNHNLGPIELYRSPQRGVRPIFYGLGNFFWSDVQDPLPHDLFQGNRAMLSAAWQDPAKATDYDLTAPLNRQSFAHDFTFRSVIAVSRFEGNQLAELKLYPVEDGYGERLTRSGIPRLVTDQSVAMAIFKQISDATHQYGLPELDLGIADNVATLHPDHEQDRVPLHPEARQLAQHGGDRDRSAANDVPGPAHRATLGVGIRDRHLGAPSQCEPRENPMDVRLRESAQENAPRLPADQLRNPCYPGCRAPTTWQQHRTLESADGSTGIVRAQIKSSYLLTERSSN